MIVTVTVSPFGSLQPNSVTSWSLWLGGQSIAGVANTVEQSGG